MADTTIKINIDSTGSQKSLATLTADIEATRVELDRLIATYGENSAEADKMRTSLAGLEIEYTKMGGAIEESNISVGSLKAQLRQLTNELAQLEPGSARFTELSQKAGQLRDQIKDTNDVINATAGTGIERFGTALQKATQLGVAGFQGLLSVQTLLGSENQDLQKQLVKLTAVLNLSQAITAFGGLRDTFIAIRAGIVPLVTNMYSFVAAQVAATGASGALATAMNAIPFVALATAIGLAVYGIYNYVTASNQQAEKEKELAKIEEEREKQVKALAEAQEQEREKVGESSVEYVNLIQKLKQTNAGSLEREKLIKKINDQYGTTLKNIKDESKFQDQLNLSVKEYIALQVLRVRQEAKKKEEAKAIANLVKAQDALAKIEKEYAGLSKQQIEDYDQKTYGVSVYSDAIIRANLEIENAQSVAEQYAISTNDLQNEIDKLGLKFPKVIDGTEKHGNASKKTKKEVKDYGDIIKSIGDILDQNQKLEEENYIKFQELSNKTVDVKEIEKTKLIENIRKVYEANKKLINSEVTDSKKKTDLLKANEDAFTKFLSLELDQRRIDIEIANKKRLQDATDLNRYLLLEEQGLQKEIRFGDGDTTDTKLNNANKITSAYIKELETQQLRSEIDNRVKIKKQVEFLKEREALQRDFIQTEQQTNREAGLAEIKRILDIEIQKYNIEKKYLVQGDLEKEISVKRNAQFTKQDLLIQLTAAENLSKTLVTENEKKNNQIKIDDLKAQIEIADLEEKNATIIQKNLNQLKTNLNEEYNQQQITDRVQANNKLVELEITTQNTIFEIKVKRLNEYLQYASQIYGELSTITSLFQKNQIDTQKNQLDSYVSYEKTKLDQQLANRLVTQEEYDARVRQINIKRQQDELKLARKQFRIKKALDIAGATIDGARATLSVFAQTPGELIIKSIAAGLAAVFAGVQIALISKQQFTANKGGIVPGNSMINKDSVSSYLTPGEVVINRNSSQQFLPLLDLINRSGGGAQLIPDLPASTTQINRFQPVYQKTNTSPIRAYVVSSDIESNLGKIDRIRRATKF